MEQTQKTTRLYSHDELYDALLFVQDILDRAAIPCLVLGDVANTLFLQDDSELKAPKIEIGIKKTEMTTDHVGMLNDLLRGNSAVEELEFSNKYIRFVYKEVPIFIKVIKNRYKFIDDPDLRMYFIEEFKIPNPFQQYWKMRNFIQ